MSHAHSSPGADGAAPAALSEGLAALQSTLDRLAAATEREHERAAHREKIIDRLHDDNQLLRRGELQAMLDPIRTALYRLHDMVRRESLRWAGGPADPPDPAHVGPLLSAIADEIAEALARAGAERYTVEPGDLFDQARHRPVGTVPDRAEVIIGQATGAGSYRAARQNASAESI